MKKEFVKMHGLGNDFAIFDARQESLPLTPEKIRALGNRHLGIGFDQLIVMEGTSDADVFMRIYNADGGEVGACGNATRCVAKLTNKQKVTIKTVSELLACNAVGEGLCVDMGIPRLKWQEIPLSHQVKTDFIDIEAGLLKNPVSVNIGNPHAVFFVGDAEAVPLESLGPEIEHHPLFPEKTNVEAVQVIDRATLRMRVWERGAGITQACGTGACAAVVAGVIRGLTDRRVGVVLDGGRLDIEWRESDNHILMTGPAVEVYRGTVEL